MNNVNNVNVDVGVDAVAMRQMPPAIVKHHKIQIQPETHVTVAEANVLKRKT